MSRATLPSGLEINHTGPAPYVARSASDRDPDWPNWFVADAVGFNGFSVVGAHPTPKLMEHGMAEMAAQALNEATQ